MKEVDNFPRKKFILASSGHSNCATSSELRLQDRKSGRDRIVKMRAREEEWMNAKRSIE